MQSLVASINFQSYEFIDRLPSYILEGNYLQYLNFYQVKENNLIFQLKLYLNLILIMKQKGLLLRGAWLQFSTECQTHFFYVGSNKGKLPVYQKSLDSGSVNFSQIQSSVYQRKTIFYFDISQKFCFNRIQSLNSDTV